MGYYLVRIASLGYHKKEALTYSSEKKLQPGSIVKVELQNKHVLGVVTGTTVKPLFGVKMIKEGGDIKLPSASLKLIDWLDGYYPAPSGQITSLFVPLGILSSSVSESPNTTVKENNKSLPSLTKQQVEVIKQIEEAPGSCLLFGDTGSGKTRVYAELAKKSLQSGKSVLILTPEIGLTPQLVRDFENSFSSNQVSVFHSGQTPSERRNVWLAAAASANPMVLIGPRSALFLPINNLGLVVVDEMHENAYKQEQSPRYDGRRVASKLAELHKAKIVFGTATPSVYDYYLATQKHVTVVRMSGLATGGPKNMTIKIIDVKDRSEFTRNPYISDALLKAMEKTYSNKEQSLIFLNRRGSARTIVCKDCGWQALCKRCDLPLIYHSDSHLLRCHTCGYSVAPITVCPVCSGREILYKGAGTKLLTTQLEKLFPNSVIRRFDKDNSKQENLENSFEDIVQGKIDILVGTQMITKGLDLPKLGLVGVISADTSLNFPDYTAEEKTYQLLSQIIGRVGRGHRHGNAIVQTYHPSNQAIKTAVNKDWLSFYDREIEQRKLFGFPPFFFILKVTISKGSNKLAEQNVNSLKKRFENLKLPIIILDPTPSFFEKKGGRYRWQLIVKAKDRKQLTGIISHIPRDAKYDLDPVDLL